MARPEIVLAYGGFIFVSGSLMRHTGMLRSFIDEQ
jgi:hypothetical protein